MTGVSQGSGSLVDVILYFSISLQHEASTNILHPERPHFVSCIFSIVLIVICRSFDLIKNALFTKNDLTTYVL